MGWAAALALGASGVLGACGSDSSEDDGGTGGSTASGGTGGTAAGGTGGTGGSGGGSTFAGLTTLMELDGPWNGTFEMETFGITGGVSFEVEVDLTANTFTTTLDLPNLFPDGPDPPPETLVFSFTSESEVLANGYVATVDSKYYGELTVNLGLDGSIAVDEPDKAAQGTLSATSVSIDFFIQTPGTGVIRNQGTISAQKDGAPATLSITTPTFDCSPVNQTPGAGQACTGACTPPAGGCVQSACRQSCIVGECQSFCGADESCTRVDGQQYADGRDYAVCFPVEVGPNAPYEQCSDSLGRCQQGSQCIAFTGDTVGVCRPVCTSDADCPDVGSNQGACVFGSSLGGGQRFCALACDKGGDETCPAGQQCEASLSGGACFWP